MTDGRPAKRPAPRKAAKAQPRKAAPAKRAPAKRAPAKRPAPPPVEEEYDDEVVYEDEQPPPVVRRRRVVEVIEPEPEPQRPSRLRMPTGFSTVRDLLLFIAGMAIIVNEVFISAKVDPTAVGIGVALTGAPLVFGADERKAK